MMLCLGQRLRHGVENGLVEAVMQTLQVWRIISGHPPRVARCSQPWAERFNPFVILLIQSAECPNARDTSPRRPLWPEHGRFGETPPGLD